MAYSGFLGFLFFVIANGTNFFSGASVIAGCIQLCINTFVFITWSKGFKQSKGFKRFVASFGVIVPLILATVTFWRVLLPAIFD
jgi:hypothetical protein